MALHSMHARHICKIESISITLELIGQIIDSILKETRLTIITFTLNCLGKKLEKRNGRVQTFAKKLTR